MDENITTSELAEEPVAEEATESAEAELENDFDAGWAEAVEEDGASEEDDEMAEPAPAETQAVSEPETTDETEEPSQKENTEDQRVVLKWNGEEVEADHDRLIELAQKGLDYDRVKAERDNFKADSATMTRYKAQEDFLKELAAIDGTDIQTLMDKTRARMLMADDDELSEEEALRRVKEKSAPKAAEKKETEKAVANPEERRQAMFAEFLRVYPGIKGEDIPKEVWEDAGRTFDLVGAYQRGQIRQLQKENETLRQNNKNRERSTGSMRTRGAAKTRDDFDEGWDSEP